MSRANLDSAVAARAAATQPESSDADRAAREANAILDAAAATASGNAAGRKPVEQTSEESYAEPIVNAAVEGREKVPRTKAVIEDELRARGVTPSGEYRQMYELLKATGISRASRVRPCSSSPPTTTTRWARSRQPPPRACGDRARRMEDKVTTHRQTARSPPRAAAARARTTHPPTPKGTPHLSTPEGEASRAKRVPAHARSCRPHHLAVAQRALHASCPRARRRAKPSRPRWRRGAGVCRRSGSERERRPRSFGGSCWGSEVREGFGRASREAGGNNRGGGVQALAPA